MILQRFSTLLEMNLRCRSNDAELGRVNDLLVEDDRWHVRYVVINLASAGRGRPILISTAALRSVDPARSIITTDLDPAQVFNSPPVDFNQPISRQYEQALVDYYGWPIYWLGRLIRRSPRDMIRESPEAMSATIDEEDSANLRSVKEICGYQLRCRGKTQGYLEDLIINVQSWSTARAVVNPFADCPITEPYAIVPCSNFSSVDWVRQQIQVNPSSTEDRMTGIAGDSHPHNGTASHATI